MQKVVLENRPYGRLTPKGTPWSVKGVRYSLFECECGTICTKHLISVSSGRTKSCGCLHKEAPGVPIKHGLKSHPLYDVYKQMIDRCTNSANKRYKDYGGRGITVCDEWLVEEHYIGLTTFYNWGISNGWEKGLSIERINNDGPYAPCNCKWATDGEQRYNKRSTVILEYKGNDYTVVEIIRLFAASGISIKTFRSRLGRGWSLEDALTYPLGYRNVKI